MGLRDALRNAFALDPPEPDPDLDAFIEVVAAELVRRRLGAAAVLMLASGMPLAFLSSQLMVFAEPLVQVMWPTRSYKQFAALLEQRENVEKLVQRIEAIEKETTSRPRG